MQKYVVILFFFAAVHNISGQESTIKEELIELGIPSHPAMTLMGIQPQEITRPKSLKQMEATIINSFTQEGSFAIPKNFALEIMPYWLKSKPYKEFRYEDLAKAEFAPLENLGISVGTSSEKVNDSLFRPRIGFGARTLIFSGKVEKAKLDSLNRLAERFRFLSYSNEKMIIVLFTMMARTFPTYQAFFDTIESELRKSMHDRESGFIEKEILKAQDFFIGFIPEEKWNDAPADTLTTLMLAEMMMSELDRKMNDTEFTELAAQVQEMQARKTGFFWEVAASTFLEFPKGDFNYSTVPKLGAWTTITYVFPENHFGLLATLRYIRDFQTETNTSNLDFGGSVFYQTHKIAFAAELLQRYQSTTLDRSKDPDGYELHTTKTRYEYRSSLNISYRLSESLVVAYTFGKSFGTTDNLQSNIVNQLSLNFGLGMIPLKL